MARCIVTSDQPKEGLQVHKIGDQEVDSMPPAYGRIQTQNTLSNKLVFKRIPPPNDGIDPRNENSRPQHELARNVKRKANKMESTTCEQCGKIFQSVKAKHGHMRSHSDRIPMKVSKQSSELSTWSLTTRRCQIPAENDEVYIAADILMQISRGNSYLSGDQVTINRMDSNESEDIKIGMTSNKISMTSKYGPSRMYHCSICKTAFNTSQALGGHITGHNRRNETGEKGKLVEGSGAKPMRADEWVDSSNTMNNLPTMDHVCEICGLTFPTGQALGGHKRKHWTGPIIHPASKSNSLTESSVERAETVNPPVVPVASAEMGIRPVVHFDLNEIPTVED